MFENKVMLVTGGAAGLGAATVTAARAQGAQVVALDVQDEAGAELAARTGAIFMHCDVSQVEDWQQVAKQLESIGTPDYLYLNAGIQIAPPDAPMEEYAFDALTPERYRRMMGVNVDGVVYGLHTLLPMMQAHSAIVVTCSLAGVTPYSIDPLYSTSKHAVAGLVRSLGPVLAKRNIKINAICPGAVDTALIPQAQRAALEQEQSEQQDKPEDPRALRLMTPERLALDVLDLFDAPETGKTWAKVAQDKPPFIIRAPGDKNG